jgi:DNA-binding PadR family transcriptional regulator
MRAEALKGHLDGLLLAVLEAGPAHGYALMETLRTSSGGAFDLPTGTVYPALRRLEAAGWLSGSWSTVGGRQRRTYRLTRAGRSALAAQRADWVEFSTVMSRFLGAAARPAR